MTNEYLSHHNLHFKPLSTRLLASVLFVRTQADLTCDHSKWHGRLVISFSQFLMRGTQIFLIPIALVESAAMSALGFLTAILNSACRYKAPCFEKFSLKCFSYSLHSVLTCGVAFAILIKPPAYFYHTLNKFVDILLHVSTAGLAQALIGPVFNRMAGRYNLIEVATLQRDRLTNLVHDRFPNMVQNMANSLWRDLGANPLNIQNLQHRAYLIQIAQYRDLLVDPAHSLEDPAQRGRWQNFGASLLQQMDQVGDGLERVNPLMGGRVIRELNGRHTGDLAYQKYLGDTVKTALVKIYKDDNLVKNLSPTGSAVEGRGMITDSDASVYIPLSNYAQYLELINGAIKCPTKFQSAALKQYDPRRQKIELAQILLKKFTNQMNETLIKKLLGSSSVALDGFSEEQARQIKQLFAAINELSGPLHQGKLLQPPLFSTNHLSYFNKACQEALVDIARLQ